MRDQRRVVVGQQRAVAGEEVEQVRHELQVGLGTFGLSRKKWTLSNVSLHDVLDTVAKLARDWSDLPVWRAARRRRAAAPVPASSAADAETREQRRGSGDSRYPAATLT